MFGSKRRKDTVDAPATSSETPPPAYDRNAPAEMPPPADNRNAPAEMPPPAYNRDASAEAPPPAYNRNASAEARPPVYDTAATPPPGASVAERDAPAVAGRRTETGTAYREPVREPVAEAPVDDRHTRALRRYRGFNLGAAFYGWLVSVGVDVILASLLAAAGAAITLQQSSASLSQNATTLTLAGAISLLVVLVIGYFAGGYVAGRLSRFGGAVQGAGVWVIALLVTVALAVAGYVAGSQYNVLGQLHLPSLPTQGQSLATGGIIALVVIAVVTLLAAMLGGVVGHNYHVRVDRALAGSQTDVIDAPRR